MKVLRKMEGKATDKMFDEKRIDGMKGKRLAKRWQIDANNNVWNCHGFLEGMMEN